jgi:serine/threonine protein kinase
LQPERVLGHELDQIKGDVWALGITLIELALGRFPYGRIQPPEADWMLEGGNGEPDNAEFQLKEDTQAELQLHHDSISAAQLGYASPTEDESFAEAQDRTIQPGEKNHPVQPREKVRPIEPGEPAPSGPAWAKQGVTWRGEENTMSVIDLLRVIVYEDAPRLPEGCFEQEVEQFVDGCLKKDTEKRMSPRDLVVSAQSVLQFVCSRTNHGNFLQGHAWLNITREKAVNIKAWAGSI